MKLNFDFSVLSAAVEKMGAVLIDFDISSDIAPLDAIDTQLGEGLEVNLEDIQFDTGLASYQGRQVLLYIKDHGGRVGKALEDGAQGNRYHIADCGTLTDMRAKGRFDRYVVTNKLTGFFEISGDDWGTNQHMEGETNLSVCRNCLKHLNYQGYRNKAKGPIFSSFNLTDFFDTYSSFFKFMPSGVANTKDVGYSADWPQVSNKLKTQKNFICQQCSLDLSHNKRLLHVHHINGVKNDNSITNLRVLCADCHRKQPNHQHLFIKHEDTRLISQLRNQQGITAKDNWKEVYDLADPAMHGVLNMLEKYQVPPPSVGEEIQALNKKVVTELELAWAMKRIAVAIDKESAIVATKLGWKVYSMRHALKQMDQLTSSLR